MRRSLFAASILGGAFGLIACSAVLGVDDFKVKSTTTDQSDGATDGSSGGLGDGHVDPGNEAGPDSEAGALADCTLNADCDKSGDNFICRKSDHKCISLVTSDCAHIRGNYKDDNAIIIGSVLPTAGADETSGLPEQRAIDLAIDDFKGFGNLPAAPGSTARRPLVLVGCNDNSNDDTAIAAATHLVKDVEVPAIIGAAFSGITLKVANQVTIPSGTFLISPSATSTTLTGLDDNGLVWRTIANDNIQADADVAFYPEIEKKIRTDKGDNTYPVHVGIAYKGDDYGKGLFSALTTKLSINGAPFLDDANKSYVTYNNYGDPDGTPNYGDAVTKLLAGKPDVVYLFGTTEAITDVLDRIETDAATTKPLYVISDGGLVGQLKDYIEDLRTTKAKPADAENLRRRILGTVPGTTSQIFKSFTSTYAGVYHDGLESTSGVANAYDATYNIAYAIAGAKAAKVTGTSIRDGFAFLVGGKTVIDMGSTHIGDAFTQLNAGNKIDYNGASGPLEYDSHGDVSADIQIWCLSKDTTTMETRPGAGTSVVFDASKGKMVGDYAKLTSDCNWDK